MNFAAPLKKKRVTKSVHVAVPKRKTKSANSAKLKKRHGKKRKRKSAKSVKLKKHPSVLPLKLLLVKKRHLSQKLPQHRAVICRTSQRRRQHSVKPIVNVISVTHVAADQTMVAARVN